jgi:hypothetical protein
VAEKIEQGSYPSLLIVLALTNSVSVAPGGPQTAVRVPSAMELVDASHKGDRPSVL